MKCRVGMCILQHVLKSFTVRDSMWPAMPDIAILAMKFHCFCRGHDLPPYAHTALWMCQNSSYLDMRDYGSECVGAIAPSQRAASKTLDFHKFEKFEISLAGPKNEFCIIFYRLYKNSPVKKLKPQNSLHLRQDKKFQNLHTLKYCNKVRSVLLYQTEPI